MNYFDHIDDYLQNRLDESLRTEFERALGNDASLKEELDFRKSMQDGFSEEETYALKSRIQTEVVSSKSSPSSSPELNSKGSTNKPFFKWWWLAIPFLFVLGYFIGKSFKTEAIAPKALYAQYHQPNPRLGGVRNTEGQNPLDLILKEMYQGGDYKGVYGRITDLPPSEVNHDYLYTLGLACVELDRDKEAIEIFDQFISNANPLYQDEALWSKAMVYLKMDYIENAKSILKGIVKDGKKNSAKAQEILDAL